MQAYASRDPLRPGLSGYWTGSRSAAHSAKLKGRKWTATEEIDGWMDGSNFDAVRCGAVRYGSTEGCGCWWLCNVNQEA